MVARRNFRDVIVIDEVESLYTWMKESVDVVNDIPYSSREFSYKGDGPADTSIALHSDGQVAPNLIFRCSLSYRMKEGVQERKMG